MKFIKPLHYSLIQKYHKGLVKKEIVKYAKGKILDIGCGEKPFYPFVKDKVDEYIGVDHPDTPHSKAYIDVFAPAHDLPFQDNYFDVVLLTQVIEHLETPLAVLKEIYRVLKEDGILIISWPFLYPIHEAPRDFFRYTSYGMEYLSQKSGFLIKKLTPVSGFWITYFSFLSIYILRKSKLIYGLLFPLIFIFKYFCLLLEMIDRNADSRSAWTWSYYIILEKRSDGK